MKVRLLRKWRKEAYIDVFIAPAVGHRGYRVWSGDNLLATYNLLEDAKKCCARYRREYVMDKLYKSRKKYWKRLDF